MTEQEGARVRAAVEAIRPLDQASMQAARLRQDELTKPQGALGRLEELSIQLAGIQRTPLPAVRGKLILTMAGDHGVVAEGVTLYPQAVTAQMVYNFLRGGAGVNVLARHVGARVTVVDMGVAEDLRVPAAGIGGAPAGGRLVVRKIRPGTDNLAAGPAMSRDEAAASLAAGIGVVEEEAAAGVDILGVGEMGIGNTTAASAICAAFTGQPPREVTGRGTGLNDQALVHKVSVVERALAVNRPEPGDPLGVLAALGGFEIGGMAGAMLAAASRGMAVVIDGFICGAAALVACALAPALREYLIASHQSVERGHTHVLRHLGLRPVFNLDLRLGEGTGAALGISMVEAAARILSEMATFSEAGVSGHSS